MASDKFEKEELPLILAALHKAKTAGHSGSVTINFAANGGVLGIERKLTEQFK